MVFAMRRVGWGVLLLGTALLVGCGGTGIVNYGTISTFAGSTSGNSGDGGAATSAKLTAPVGLVGDTAGNLYISDATANVVRRVSAAGTISTVAGNGTAGFSGDGGLATAAQLNAPQGLALDAAGNLYIADSTNNVIRRVATGTGLITTVAGNGTNSGSAIGSFSGDGSLAILAGLAHPFGVAFDTAGNMYIADTENDRIRKVIAATGLITTIAGNGGTGLNGDGGAATSATMYNPEGLRVDGSGNIYVAEEANSVIRLITAAGTISTYAGGVKYGFQGNGGSATNAQLNGPTAIAFDPSGNVYFTDGGNSQIRRVVAGGTIQTVAGNGTQGFAGDGHNATDANLNRPRGLFIASNGVMYIADTGNTVVRKVMP